MIDINADKRLLTEQGQGAGQAPGVHNIEPGGEQGSRRRRPRRVAVDDQESRLLGHAIRLPPAGIRTDRTDPALPGRDPPTRRPSVTLGYHTRPRWQHLRAKPVSSIPPRSRGIPVSSRPRTAVRGTLATISPPSIAFLIIRRRLPLESGRSRGVQPRSYSTPSHSDRSSWRPWRPRTAAEKLP